MKKNDSTEKIQLPFVIKTSVKNKVIAALMMPVGVFILGCLLFLSISSPLSQNQGNVLGLVLVVLIFGIFGVFLCVWPILTITKITCTEEGIGFSACMITYSRIQWKDITKVETQTLNFSALNPLAGPGQMDFSTINIYHKRSFWGMPSAITVSNYGYNQLFTLLSLLREKKGR